MATSKKAEEERPRPEDPTLKQGFVRDKDLNPDEEEANVMTPGEVNSFAQKAKSENQAKGDALQGEGDYQAAESYNEAATGFAQGKKGKQGV